MVTVGNRLIDELLSVFLALRVEFPHCPFPNQNNPHEPLSTCTVYGCFCKIYCIPRCEMGVN